MSCGITSFGSHDFSIKCSAACLCNYTIPRVVQLEKSFLKFVSFNCFSRSTVLNRTQSKRKQLKYLVSKKSSLPFPDWLQRSFIYQSIPWPATRISRLVADAQLEVQELLCESYSQRIGRFHQNKLVLSISQFQA